MKPNPERAQWRAYLQLMRAPNLFTAPADILAGYFLVASANQQVASLICLLLASASLYTGGIVLNDFFDYETDCRERPQRPLPSGQISRRTAARLGFSLLILGWLLAAASGTVSAWVALALIGLIISYDALTKNMAALGSLNMGACRFLNFLLGMSLGPLATYRLLVPILTWVYVTAITTLSKGEVSGGSRRPAIRAVILLLGVLVWFLLLSLWHILPNRSALIALALFAAIFFRPTLLALARPTAANITQAVKLLVLGLIPLDAIITIAAKDWTHGALILLLMVPALFLSRYLYVT
ncbi:MAG: UbiA-like protein EboC [Acidobacteria bacterium]|nr:UbiA-like protein EboC [Acidobacteriota bacterium]MBI3658041.1 UbiA-like protein EboC [Acidobacteriota bacterium]